MGMIHITYIQEDQVILATVHDSLSATVTVTDLPTGKQRTVTCNTKVLAAALALAVGGDEIKASEELYPVAETLMAELTMNGEDNDLRFIP